MIEERVRPRRRNDSERHGDRHGYDEPEHGELGGGRQAGLDLVGDRLAGGERIAEVAAGQVADVANELQVKRFVEAEFHADLLDRFLRGRGSGEIGRGIPGQRPRQQERDDHHADEARHRDEHAFGDHP